MKRLISVILASVMLISVSMVSFASETIENIGFVEAGKVYVEVEPHSLASEALGPVGALPASEEQRVTEIVLYDVEESLESANTYSVTWTNLSGFQVYNQSSTYNCGPACVQAVLAYFGTTLSQSDIADSCTMTPTGAQVASMWQIINSSLHGNPGYNYVTETNQNSMQNSLYSAIVSNGKPCIIGLAFREEDGWYYSTEGHYMSVYSAKSDRTRFGLGDPWIGFSTDPDLADAPWSYTKDSSTIYTAFSLKEIGMIY